MWAKIPEPKDEHGFENCWLPPTEKPEENKAWLQCGQRELVGFGGLKASLAPENKKCRNSWSIRKIKIFNTILMR